jgi:hypothetical protein
VGVGGRHGLYGLLRPFVDVPAGLRRVLAADAATAFSATDLVRRAAPDNLVALGSAVRGLLATAASRAFGGMPVDPQVRVTADGEPPALFVRRRQAGGGLVLAGQVPVSWAVLPALGVAVVEGGTLLVETSAVAGRDPGTRWGRGYVLRRGRDADLTPVEVELPVDVLRRRIAIALDA